MTSQTSTEDTTPTAPTKKRSLRLLLLTLVPLLVVLVSFFVYLNGGRYIETDNAYIKADKIPVSAEVSGTIKKVFVDENQAVKAGEALFQIDPAPFAAVVDKAEAHLAQVRTNLAALKASYREKQAQINLARSKYHYAQKEQRRLISLKDKDFVSAAQLDSASQKTQVAKLQVAADKKDLQRIATTLGGSVTKPITRHPSYLSALAELHQAKLDLARTTVRASVDGSVNKHPKLGQYVNAGTTVTALVASGQLWIEANFTETNLTYVHPGQSVNIHIDTFPDKDFNGTVDSLSPATGSEFSIIPAENATGNWVKITQRVPVKITFNKGQNLPNIRAGLSTIVTVDTQHQRHFLGLSL